MATTFPNSPRHAKGVLLLMDPGTGNYTGIIKLQINPSQLTRTLKVRGAGAEGGDRSEAMRLTGPPVETMNVEAELDATDKLEDPDKNEDAVEFGLRPELAALESMVYPDSALLQENHELSKAGMLEILPVEAPLILFGWGKNRLLPVRITELSVAEEAFDQELNPIRAKVTLGMQVLSVNDLPYDHRGTSLYLRHHHLIESLRQKPGGAVAIQAAIISATIEGS
jgi:Contractile injection system tube protein